MISQLIAGGQTGVERAALDAAMQAGVQVGGWCPKTRKAEDGVIPDTYPLNETFVAEYDQRTEWNVRDSDGTLAIIWGTIIGGAQLTKGCCDHYQKPFLIVDLNEPNTNFDIIVDWLINNKIRVLNVEGPRESHCEGIYDKAKLFISELLRIPIDSLATA
jgi:hypothetical protein